MKSKAFVACAILAAVSTRAQAQWPVVVSEAPLDQTKKEIADAIHLVSTLSVEPIPGYVCDALNLPPDQVANAVVPIMTAPTVNSPKLGNAASIVFAKSPPHIENGFAEVKFPNGKPGWIEARMLRPAPFSCLLSQTADGRVRIGR
jgi:hypothetical protein